MEFAGTDAHRTVVLIDGAAGREMHAVSDALTAAWRMPVLLLGPADLRGSAVAWDAGAGMLLVGRRRVRPALVWARHCGAQTLVARSGLPAPAAAAWTELIAAVSHAAPVALPGPAPRPAEQLTHARRLAVRVPRTVITADPGAAAGLLDTARIVVKQPDFRLTVADPAAWVPYLPVVSDAADPPEATPGRPVTVQEYVEHDHELRVYYLDGSLCAFRVRKPHPAALWTRPSDVEVTAIDCPRPASAVVRRLATAWGLRYAAFDLLVTRSGETVFLEANADGDWLFFERRAGRHGVSILAAAMVRELSGRELTEGRAGERSAA